MHASCISATTCPARRITAIWARVLRRVTVQGASTYLSTTFTMRSNTSSPSPTPSTVVEQALRPVVVDDRHGLLLVELEPALDRLFGVVVALTDLAAARVARPVDGGRHVDVVHALAVLADAPAREAVEHDLARHVEVDDEVERRCRRSPGRAHAPECSVRGKPSSTKPSPSGPPGAVHSSITPMTISSGTSSPRVHVALGLEPERGALRGLRAEQSPVERCVDAVVRRPGARPGFPCRHLASRAARVGASLSCRSARGSPRSYASSAGCRAASSSRA